MSAKAPASQSSLSRRALPARTAGRPPRIRSEQIVAAAIEIGLADLTLAAVAKRLGVSTQALYRYFPDRESLVDAVAEELVRRFPIPPSEGEDWAEWAFRFAHALRRLFEALPGLADRAMVKTQATPGILIRYEKSISVALQCGFDEVTALWATRAVTEFVHAWVARDQRRSALAAESGMTYRESLQDAVEARQHIDMPAFAGALKKSQRATEKSRFDYTLRCLLAGIALHRRNGFSWKEKVE
jgi:AcrR family transcriptional regulator